MKILIDLQSCQSGSKKGGIGRYSLELVKSMLRINTDHEINILLTQNLPDIDIRYEFRDLLPQSKIKTFTIPNGVSALNNNPVKTEIAEIIREKFICDLKPDLIYITSLIEGLGDEVVTSIGRLYPAERTAVILYDLIPLADKDRYLTDDNVTTHYLNKILQLQKSSAIMAISEFSRQQGIDLLDIHNNNIINISSGVETAFKPNNISDSLRSHILNKFSIKKHFILYTGSFDSRKNHGNLIKGFAMLPQEKRNNFQLVIVGNGWGGIYSNLHKLAIDSGLEKSDLLFLGHVTDSDLLSLYRLCYLFVFPSLSEGFGLPALEAMSCGAPVIASDCTSIPEVIGWPDALFDPYSVESISNMISKTINDDSFYKALKTHARRQSKKFSWEKSASRAMSFLKMKHQTLLDKNYPICVNPYSKCISSISNIADIHNENNISIDEIAYCLAINEAKLQKSLYMAPSKSTTAWITTWNTPCGIAEYSKLIIENFETPPLILAPYADTLLQNDQNNVIRCWDINSDNFDNIRDAIKKNGIKILIIQFNYGFFDFNELNKFLIDEKSRGLAISITLHSTNDPDQTIYNKTLANITAGLNAIDIVYVHSNDDINKMQSIGVSRNLKFLPQGMIDYNPKKHHDISVKGKQLFTIASYGFLLPHKGIFELVKATRSLISKGFNIKVLLVNSLYPVDASHELKSIINDYIHREELHNNIELISDFLSNEESINILNSADLIIFPYQNTGESSSAAVRMGIASGTPVAVTPLSIFDDVADVTLKLPGSSVSELVTGIEIIRNTLQASNLSADFFHRVNLWKKSHSYSDIANYINSQLTVCYETNTFQHNA